MCTVLAPPTPDEGTVLHIGPKNSFPDAKAATTRLRPLGRASRLAVDRYRVMYNIIGTFRVCQEKNLFLAAMSVTFLPCF